MTITVNNQQLIKARRKPSFGMRVSDGYRIENNEHLTQGLRDILTTTRGQRVMLRGYGLIDITDKLASSANVQHVYSDIDSQFKAFEPRFVATEYSVDYDSQSNQFAFRFKGKDSDGLVIEGDL